MLLTAINSPAYSLASAVKSVGEIAIGFRIRMQVSPDINKFRSIIILGILEEILEGGSFYLRVSWSLVPVLLRVRQI